ncbi:MAG: PEGA domain-containing protein [Terriglobales bacterium]|jgi:PEGA domain-containing protein
MMRKECFRAALIGICLVGAAIGKDQPAQVIVWPENGSPVVRISLGKFKEISRVGNQHNYVIETTAENLWSKAITSATFNLYLFDKGKARIGEGWITLSSVASGESVKFQTFISASGTPESVTLAPRSLLPELGPAAPAHTVSITVNSVPQGAEVNVDGAQAGTTPKVLQLTVGKHLLEFNKEGFNTGHFPLEIAPNDASGGSVSYELGASARDTIELRDGSVLNGDLESVSGTEVVVKIGGSLQTFNRNQVKRILFVEREPPSQ